MHLCFLFSMHCFLPNCVSQLEACPCEKICSKILPVWGHHHHHHHNHYHHHQHQHHHHQSPRIFGPADLKPCSFFMFRPWVLRSRLFSYILLYSGQALTGTRYPTRPGLFFSYPNRTRKTFQNFRVQGSSYICHY